MPFGHIIISEDLLTELSEPTELSALIQKLSLENSQRNPLKKVIAEQTILHLIKFLFGLEKALIINNVEIFQVKQGEKIETQNLDINDFSWVSLKNICLT